MPVLRLPLEVQIESRDSTLEKDSLIANGFIEKSNLGGSYVVKRPGLNVFAEGYGVGLGIYTFDGVTFNFTNVRIDSWGTFGLQQTILG